MSSSRSDDRPVTLVCRAAAEPYRPWNVSATSPTRVVFGDPIAILNDGLRDTLAAADDAIACVVFDRAIFSIQFLDLLASLPMHYTGDLVLVRPDGHGYLSAMYRNHGRMLVPLDVDDVAGYLEAKQLVTTAASAAA